MEEYKPPFTITNKMLSYVSTISEKIGRITAISNMEAKPHLRRNNRIKSIEDVLVIYCALYPDAIEKETYVVGWYQHATVCRNYEIMRFPSEDEEAYYDQAYNAIARKEDCVLLPRASRRKANTWKVPRKSKGVAYGFGQSNVWFAQGREDNKLLDQFLNKIVRQIEEYDGENWIDKYAE